MKMYDNHFAFGLSECMHQLTSFGLKDFWSSIHGCGGQSITRQWTKVDTHHFIVVAVICLQTDSIRRIPQFHRFIERRSRYFITEIDLANQKYIYSVTNKKCIKPFGEIIFHGEDSILMSTQLMQFIASFNIEYSGSSIIASRYTSDRYWMENEKSLVTEKTEVCIGQFTLCQLYQTQRSSVAECAFSMSWNGKISSLLDLAVSAAIVPKRLQTPVDALRQSMVRYRQFVWHIQWCGCWNRERIILKITPDYE